MFQDALNIAVGVSQVAGTPLQGDNIIQDFGRTWNKQDWFRKQAPQGNQGNVASQANELLNKLGSSEMGAGLKPANVEKPSLNTAEGQAGI